MDRYSQTRLVNPESVLEHTGWVCFCSLLIAGELKKAGEDIDIGRTLIKATVHDMEEYITGDIACPTKYWDHRITHEIKRIEGLAGIEACNALDPSGKLYEYWDSAKDGKEGFVVALADKLAVVYKVQQEISNYGNNTLKGHIKGLIPALDALEVMARVGNDIDNHEIITEIINEAKEICHTLI